MQSTCVPLMGFGEVTNYFEGEPIGTSEVEVRVGKLKNEKAAGKDEIAGEIMKGGLDLEAM